MLIGNIAANVIAVMAFVAFLNSIFNWFGSLVGFDELTFEVSTTRITVNGCFFHGEL